MENNPIISLLGKQAQKQFESQKQKELEIQRAKEALEIKKRDLELQQAALGVKKDATHFEIKQVELDTMEKKLEFEKQMKIAEIKGKAHAEEQELQKDQDDRIKKELQKSKKKLEQQRK